MDAGAIHGIGAEGRQKRSRKGRRPSPKLLITLVFVILAMPRTEFVNPSLWTRIRYCTGSVEEGLRSMRTH